MQDLTNFEGKVEKSKHSTVLHKSVKLVESCTNSWMDLQVNLSELVAAHLVYVNPMSMVLALLFNVILAFSLRGSNITKVKLWQHYLHLVSLK